MLAGDISWKGRLTRGVYRASEWLRAGDVRVRRRNTRFRAQASASDLPLPPERLVVQVAGSPDLGWFLEGGRLAAEGIAGAVQRHGMPFPSMQAVLDFGCGCGRVLRHFPTDGPLLHGSDYNDELIAWCRRHLPGGEFATNRLEPPLAWPDGRFDAVWALSVFTHLPEDLQFRWLSELRRVLRPGGLLIASTQGERYADRLTPSERERFEQGQLVVRFSEASGTNLCSAFHPWGYVRQRFADGFELLELAPEGATGNPHQDLVVLRRPA